MLRAEVVDEKEEKEEREGEITDGGHHHRPI